MIPFSITSRTTIVPHTRWHEKMSHCKICLQDGIFPFQRLKKCHFRLERILNSICYSIRVTEIVRMTWSKVSSHLTHQTMERTMDDQSKFPDRMHGVW